MWRLGYSEMFLRTARKLTRRDSALRVAVTEALSLLEQDPHHPHLKLHALRGSLEGLWAARVTYKVRLILILRPDEQAVILVDIGSHDEVYE